MDYSLRDRNAIKGTDAYDKIAQIHYLDHKNDTDPYSIVLKRDRVRRGYGINAPITDDGEGMRTHFTVSKTKDYRWFSGLQLSFAF